MNYKCVIYRINSDLNETPEVRDSCIKIINHINDTKNIQNLKHISYGFLKKITNLPLNKLTMTINYLCGSRVSALDIEYGFFDGIKNIDIDYFDFKEAQKTGIFYHPETGEPVEDFDNKIYIYFKCSPSFFNNLKVE